MKSSQCLSFSYHWFFHETTSFVVDEIVEGTKENAPSFQ